MPKPTEIARKLLEQGNSIAYIKKYLSHYSFSPREIDQALTEASFLASTRAPSRSRKQTAKVPVVLVILILVLTLSAAYAVLKLTGLSEPILLEQKSYSDQEILQVKNIEKPTQIAIKTLDCTSMEPKEKDMCLSKKVKETRLPEYCKDISSNHIRDECYLSFVMEGSLSLCSNLVIESNKEYCGWLIAIKKLSNEPSQ